MNQHWWDMRIMRQNIRVPMSYFCTTRFDHLGQYYFWNATIAWRKGESLYNSQPKKRRYWIAKRSCRWRFGEWLSRALSALLDIPPTLVAYSYSSCTLAKNQVNHQHQRSLAQSILPRPKLVSPNTTDKTSKFTINIVRLSENTIFWRRIFSFLNAILRKMRNLS